MNATGPWLPMSKLPKPGRSYLIEAVYGGVTTYDVAFYNGRRKDGSHWWTLANVELDSAVIAAYSEILEREGAPSDQRS